MNGLPTSGPPTRLRRTVARLWSARAAREFLLAIAFAVLFNVQPTLGADAPIDVTVNAIKGGKARASYMLELITFIMDKSGEPYELSYLEEEAASQDRNVRRLEQGEDITLMWTGTSRERETRLRPVRFPVMRGLLGYRIGIIDADSQGEFAAISTADELLEKTVCQGHDWPDTEILANARFRLETPPLYESLFKLLSMGRCDWFLRAIFEPYVELENFGALYPDLAIEENWLVVYRYPMFFFVGPENERLARALETGFERSYADGSFLEFFERFDVNRLALERTRPEERRCVVVENPGLTEATRAIPEPYWFEPMSEIRERCEVVGPGD